MLLGVVMSKNMVFPTLEPALPKLPNHDIFERPKGHQNKCRHTNSQFDTSLQKLHGIIWWKCFDCGRLRRVNFLDKDTITINEFST